MEETHINKFTIHRKLPSLNEVIQKNRANRYAGAQFKADIEEAIGWDIKQALTAGTLKPVAIQCIINMIFYETTNRRDVDNIQSSQKFILDAMVKNGILKDDSRRYVKQIYHTIENGKTDEVKVYIREIGDMDEE